MPTARAWASSLKVSGGARSPGRRRKIAALLEEIEGGVGADAVDAARGYVAGYSQMTDVGFVAHALELADRDV